MVDPFAAALDALFHAPGSAAALVAGVEQPVRTIPSRPDALSRFGGSRVLQGTQEFQFRLAEVPNLANGQEVRLLDDAGEEIGRYKIVGAPALDSEGLTWTCGSEPTS